MGKPIAARARLLAGALSPADAVAGLPGLAFGWGWIQ